MEDTRFKRGRGKGKERKERGRERRRKEGGRKDSPSSSSKISSCSPGVHSIVLRSATCIDTPRPDFLKCLRALPALICNFVQGQDQVNCMSPRSTGRGLL